jgi:hypothetical protein
MRYNVGRLRVRREKMTTTMEHNGNKFVNAEHVFVEGKGCFFPSIESSRENSAINGNSVGIICQTIEYNGSTWYRHQETNVWD